MKPIAFAVFLILAVWMIWYANSVFLLAFGAILLAILLNAIGRGTQKITRLSYSLSLLIGISCILGVLVLIFWLYSPLLTVQFQALLKQLPQAAVSLHNNLNTFFGVDLLTQERLQRMFSLSDQKIWTQLFSVFSSTLGSIAGLIVILIVSLYLALDPGRNLNWVLQLLPPKKKKHIGESLEQIGQSLRWWLIGKLGSMAFVGILSLTGLSILHVSLALILAFLAALLTFIPYVGAIISSVPAIMIAFAQSPLKAFYVLILYTGIHLVDGYFITPSIEQKTVSIPPAVTIMAQVLMMVLIGGVGLALATPLAVVAIAITHRIFQPLK